MNVQEEERAAIEHLSNRYLADGFEVISSTSAFRIGNYIPDLVVKQGDRVILVEVKHRKTPTIEKHLTKLRDQIESRPNQKFEVFFLNELPLPPGPKIQTNATIDELVAAINLMLDENIVAPAFLACWAAFEAAGRRVFNERFSRSQSPGRVISVLVEEGVLFGELANSLRDLSLKRNKFIHGELDVNISKSDVFTMIKAIQAIQHYSSPPQEG